MFSHCRNGSQFNPSGLRSLLHQLATAYPSIPVYVSDIGTSTDTDSLSDKPRVQWLQYHVDEVLKGKFISRYIKIQLCSLVMAAVISNSFHYRLFEVLEHKHLLYQLVTHQLVGLRKRITFVVMFVLHGNI